MGLWGLALLTHWMLGDMAAVILMCTLQTHLEIDRLNTAYRNRLNTAYRNRLNIAYRNHNQVNATGPY